MPISLKIESVLSKNAIPLDEEKRRSLGLYVDLLIEWNSRINLVSRRDEQNVWMSHVFHSLSPLIMIDFPQNLRVLDLGTGGGLPGIPLGVVHGGLDVVLLDSMKKKTMAIEDILKRAGLGRFRVVTGRAEDVSRIDRYAGAFDMVVARAVAPLVKLVNWSAPFLRKRGIVSALRGGAKSQLKFPYLLALKGGDLEREVGEVRRKARVLAITEIPLAFPGSDALDLVDKKIVVVEFP